LVLSFDKSSQANRFARERHYSFTDLGSHYVSEPRHAIAYIALSYPLLAIYEKLSYPQS